jgi:hypothetical protein
LTKEACRGTAWGNAVPGECREEKGKICQSGLKTFVDVYKWTFKWNDAAKRCDAEIDGSVEPKQIEVDNCGGDRCSPAS